MLTAFDHCPKKFWYAYLHRYAPQGIIPGGGSIHTHAGAAYAKGLEVARKAYCAGTPPLEAVECGVEALVLAYGNVDPGDSPKSCARMVGALEQYFSDFPLETDPIRIAVLNGTPAIEWRFALPVPFNNPQTGEPLMFAGRTDFIGELAHGLWIIDDKTTGQLGAQWAKQWELRGQFTGYAWAARELGIKVAGAGVRGMCIRKTGYESAEALIGQPPSKIEEWLEWRNATIARMVGSWYSMAYPMSLSDACNAYGGCSFKQVCLVPKENRPAWLETNYVESEWSPLAED